MRLLPAILRRARRDQENARARDLRTEAKRLRHEADACDRAGNLAARAHLRHRADLCVREAAELEGRA